MPWKEILEAYYWDNLGVAMELAEDVGVGFNGSYLAMFRMIEAENMTRDSSEFSDRGDWLLLEHVPEFTNRSLEEIELVVRHSCDQVADDFGWQHGPAVLFSFLHPAADAPYIPGRAGFFVDKYPFDKVCLPTHLVQQPELLTGAIRHEYSHAMALNRSQGRCPNWLHEAIAMTAQYNGAVKMASPQRWVDPKALGRAFRHERISEVGGRIVGDAYRQAHVIGAYLVSLKGRRGLGEVLDAFVDNSFAKNLFMEATGQVPEVEAIKQVYGLSLKDIWKEAQLWHNRSSASP